MEQERLVIDVETYGLDEFKNEMVSITLKKYDSPNFVTMMIKPDELKDISGMAQKINGITLTKLRMLGEDKLDVIYKILKFMRNNFEKKPIVIGKNVHFDVRFIDSLFRDILNVRFYEYIQYYLYDLSAIAMYLQNIGVISKDVKLSNVELYKYYFGEDESTENVHSDYADVIMTERVVKKLESLND